jgi:hypothetical protein
MEEQFPRKRVLLVHEEIEDGLNLVTKDNQRRAVSLDPLSDACKIKRRHVQPQTTFLLKNMLDSADIPSIHDEKGSS